MIRGLATIVETIPFHSLLAVAIERPSFGRGSNYKACWIFGDPSITARNCFEILTVNKRARSGRYKRLYSSNSVVPTTFSPGDKVHSGSGTAAVGASYRSASFATALVLPDMLVCSVALCFSLRDLGKADACSIVFEICSVRLCEDSECGFAEFSRLDREDDDRTPSCLRDLPP